jgi:hypothetical protein
MEPYHVRASRSYGDWLFGGMGVEKKILSAKSWCYSVQFIVWVVRKRRYASHNHEQIMNRNKNSRYFTTRFSGRLKEKCWVGVCNIAEGAQSAGTGVGFKVVQDL